MKVSKSATIAAGVTGGAGIIAGGIYASLGGSSTPTIYDKIKHFVIAKDGSFSNNWRLKARKKIKGDLAKEIKDAYSLKKWCLDKYQTPLSEEPTQEENDLIALVGKWCSYTIGQKLNSKLPTENIVANSDDERGWKAKTIFLKNYEMATIRETFSLDESLQNIKKQIGEEASEWTQVKDWCVNVFDDNYLGEEDNLWKLSSRFCSKPTLRDYFYESYLSEDEALNEDWDKKVSEASEESGGAEDTKLKESITQEGLSAQEKRNILQAWCREQYDKPIDSKIYGSNSRSSSFVREFSIFCTLLINAKIGMDNVLSIEESNENVDEEQWKSKKEKLNNNSENLPLTADLETIKQNNEVDSWKKLRDWCSEVYYKPYRGAEDTLWKLAYAFCKRQ